MKYLPKFLKSVFCSILAAGASAEPFVTLDFSRVEEDVATSLDKNLSVYIDDGAEIRPDGPGGKPYLHFDGSAPSSARLNSRLAAAKLTGAEVGVSLWIRADKLTDAAVAFGFSVKSSSNFSEAPLAFSVPTKPSDFGPFNVWAKFQGDVVTGEWHHVAFMYSVSNNNFGVWLDGIPQRGGAIGADIPMPIDGFFAQPFGNGFCGSVADIRIWNTAPSSEELLKCAVASGEREKLAAVFQAVADDAAAFKPLRDWCKTTAAKVRAVGDVCSVREWQGLNDRRIKLPELRKLASEIMKSEYSDGLKISPVLPIDIYSYFYQKRLPFRMPSDGVGLSCMTIPAARGEYEARSFMAFPFVSGEFHITATALESSDGATLPAEIIDIRTVKFWHTTSSGWNSYFGGGREFPVLSGELVIHDDALVKVDRDNHRNYLRLSYPTGDRYVDMSGSATIDSQEPFMLDVEPVRDAKTFQPMRIEEGDLSQFWVTAHIPDDTKAGDYSGKLDFTLDGQPAGSIKLVVRVHPFKLPKAAPRYNIDNRFTGGWYHHTGLANKLGPVGTYKNGRANSWSNACRRLLGEYRNFAAHNMLNPFTVSYNVQDDYDLTDKQLELMREAGLETEPLYGDLPSVDSFWCSQMMRYPEKYNRDITVESNRELFHSSMAAYTNEVKRVVSALDERFGRRTMICYGIDEAGPDTVRRTMPFFMTIKHFGSKVIISGGIAEWAGFITDYNNIPAAIGRTTIRNWHESGAKCESYAAPFSGPDNPEIWRRNMGIRLYMANFDGMKNYNLYEAENVWNPFVSISRYGNFCIVYPSEDGLIDTVAWEALREGFDDIRYLTLLRRLSRTAMRSGDRDKVRLGKLSYAWAELVDSESVDLDAMRVEAVRRIVELQAVLDGVDNITALYE